MSSTTSRCGSGGASATETKAPFGIKLAIAILFFLCVGSTVIAVYLTSVVRDLEERATAIREALEGLSSAVNVKSEMDSALGSPAHTDDVVSKTEIDMLMLKLRALSRRLDALEAGDIEDLGIEMLIDRKLLEKMPPGAPAGRRVARLDDIGEKLGLSDAQKKRAAEVIDRAKEEILDILHARDEDGSTMSERITAHIREPGTREQKMQKILAEMFDESIPGTDESYFTAIMDLRQGAVTDFSSGLTDQQRSAFSDLGIGVFGIDTGYSPFAKEMKNAISGEP